MAFPSPAARSGYTWSTTSKTDHVVALSGLGTIAAGDGLLMIVGVDGGDAINSWGGWTEVMQHEPESSIRIGAAYKVAAGSDADPTLVIAGAEKIAVGLWRFDDVDFSTDPPQAPATSATAINTSPNPASFTPSGGAIDRLWIAAAANDDDDATTGYPSGWTQGNRSYISTGSGGVNIGFAETELSTASGDAGAFTIAATEAWAAIHVTVVGGAAGADPSLMPFYARMVGGV